MPKARDLNSANPSTRASSAKSSSTATSNSSDSKSTTSKSSNRTKGTVDSASSSGNQLIQSWESVKSVIVRMLGSKLATQTPLVGDPSALISAEDAKQNMHSSITLTHGFQPMRTMENAKPGVRNVCYIPTSSMFLALDKDFLNLWKSGVKIQKIPIMPPPIQSNKSLSQAKHAEAFIGLTKWIYIDAYRLHVVANKQLEIKLVGSNFETISVTSNPKPILFMEYWPIPQVVVCGEIGGIRIYRIIKQHVGHQDLYALEQQLGISKDIDDEWVSYLYYESKKKIIYAGCGSSVHMFDFETGAMIDSYNQIHELSITCISFYEPSEYLITGAKDGTIKIWNVRKSLLFDFHDHYNAISAFILVENICGANWGTLPLLVSSSLDSTIRMWNIETGQALYRIETNQPCLGMQLIKKNIFFHYTDTSIQLWNFNRFQHTYHVVLSPTVFLKRFQWKERPPRFLSAAEDGSMRLLSVLSGTNLGTGYPSDKELSCIQIEYHIENELIYCLNTNGTILIYDSGVNPFKMISIWDNSRTANRQMICCICGVDFNSYEFGQDPEIDDRIYERNELLARYIMFAGTDAGQIHMLNMDNSSDREKQLSLIQAHSAKISMLYYDYKAVKLLSGGVDGTIKLWSIKLGYTKSNSIKSSEKRLDVRLYCTAVITMEAFDNYPSFTYSICPETSQIGLHCQGELYIVNYEKTQSLRPIHKESQSGKVLSIVCTKRAKLWAAIYDDCSVKVWDSKGVLLRDIQFHEHTSSLCFANERGDLLVGLSTEIVLVRIQDYMPPHFLRQIYQIDYQDDEDEFPLVFDKDLDIWEYHKTENPSIVPEITEQAQNSEALFNQKMNDFLELSQKRREEATLRKNKRQFLSLEKDMYMKEMEFKANTLKSKAAKLIHKIDDSAPVVDSFEELDDMEVESVVPAVSEPVRGVSENKERDQSTMEKMNRFKPKMADESRPGSAQSAKGKPKSAKQTTSKQPQSAKMKSKKRRERGVSMMDDVDTLDEIDEDEDEIIKDEDEIIKEEDDFFDEDLSRASSISESDFDHKALFSFEEHETEQHHKDLIDASAKEIELLIQDKEREWAQKKRYNDLLKEEKLKNQKHYDNGMMLPNSLGIAEILPGRIGGRALVRTEELFQKENLQEMYIERRPTFSEAPRKIFKVPTFHKRAKTEPISRMQSKFTPEPSQNVVVSSEVIFIPMDDGKEEEEELDEQAILASIVGPKRPKKVEEPVLVPVPVVQPKTPDPIVPKPFVEFLKPMPLPPKPSPTPSPEPLKPIMDSSVIEMRRSTMIPTPLLPEIPLNKGDDATKKLIQIHGLEDGGGETKGDNSQKKGKRSKSSKKSQTPNDDQGQEESGKGKKSKKSRPTTVATNGENDLGKLGSDLKADVEKGQEIPDKRQEGIFDPTKYVKAVEVEDAYTIKPKKKKTAENSKLVAPTLKHLTSKPVESEAIGVVHKEKRKKIQLKPSFPKGMVFTRRLSIDNKDVVKPILNVLAALNVELDQTIPVEKISEIIHNEIKTKDSNSVIEAMDALVSVHHMFLNDVAHEDRFDTFVAPLVDAYVSDDLFVRKKVISSLVEMEIRHDNALTLLICALNERDKTLVDLAIKGLTNYGIADKEGLKRGMIELGMMKGTHRYTTNEKLERLAMTIKRDADLHMLERRRLVTDWIERTPPTPATKGLTRKDSYLESLAGPFFPPDAHDFNGKQRALVMAAESNVNYDQFWKKKYMDKIMQEHKDEGFSWDDGVEQKNALDKAIAKMGELGLPPKLPPAKSKIYVRPLTQMKKGTAAHIALAMSRALGRGGIPSTIVFPKINQQSQQRPATVFVPTITIPKTRRPFTMHG